MIPLAVAGVGAFLFPLALLEEPLAALVAGWLLGGATLLLGLLVVLIGVATAWIGIGLLILPVGAAICLLAVLPLAGGHVYYRLATLRA